MADIKQDHKNEESDNYTMGNNTDPKNMQELTQYASISIIIDFRLIQFYRVNYIKYTHLCICLFIF